VYLFLFNIVSDRYRCTRAVAFYSDVIEASVFGLYAQRSLSLHSGVGAATCISDVYRCFHSKVARTAIAIAAIGCLRLSAMAIAACMLILCANDAYMPRVFGSSCFAYQHPIASMECPSCKSLQGQGFWMKSQWKAKNPMVENCFNCCIGCSPKAFAPELPLLGYQTIECPICKQQKGRKSWKPSQWKEKNPIVPWYFNCCKECDSEAFHLDKRALQSQWFGIVGLVAQVKDEPTQIMQAFISDWLQRLPRHVRQELSHRGSLDKTYGRSYDPGNWVYYLAMKFLVPELLDYEAWNNETVGDIWESLLGATEDGGFARWMRRYLKECVAFFQLVTPETFNSLWYTHGRRVTYDMFQVWLWTEGMLDSPDGSNWVIPKG
jgi:hypothetical protein